MSIVESVKPMIQHYNHKKYWRMRDFVQNKKGHKLKKLWFVYRIKRMDAFSNASTGITFSGENCAFFAAPPHLPHGLNGIIIAPRAVIGKNARIFHQVTIGCDDIDKDRVPTIGDNVRIYPGAKIVGKVVIGDNCVIGANVVVNKDVPANTLVVLPQPRHIERMEKQEKEDENFVGC